MLTLAEVDLIITILSVVFTISLLISFTGAIFYEQQRRNLAIMSGIMAALLLCILVAALSSPFVFS